VEKVENMTVIKEPITKALKSNGLKIVAEEVEVDKRIKFKITSINQIGQV